MLHIKDVERPDLGTLCAMVGKLCAYHGDDCQMDVDAADAHFINGPLVGLIAFEGDVPVGYLVLEPHWRPTESGDLLDIAHLFVEEPARGTGIGKRLIARAADYARQVGACRLVIGTSPLNPAAAEIYRAMGFAEITKMPGPRFEIGL